MREIKFRAWDKENEEMYDVAMIDVETGEVAYTDHPTGYNADALLEQVELMQYTGLKDKNGKEIYEGDICNCREYECFGKVEWNNEEAGFYFCVVVEGGGFEEEHLYDYIDELEVIGNIHENPELLEA